VCDLDSNAGYSAPLAGLAFDFGDAPVLVCRQYEQFPHSLNMTLCAVRSDGSVASLVPTAVLDSVGGYRLNSHPAFPTLKGCVPATVGLEIVTASQDVLSLSLAGTLVEANEEVQAYRSQGGGRIKVTTHAEMHLGTYVGDVLDGIRICPEGVWIDHFGISFSLWIDSEAMDANDYPAFDNLSLNATVAPRVHLTTSSCIFFG
jgi:hypothetical protein